MTKKHSTKRALALSVLSLVLCFSMLLGTTYAWFTDSVSSANNIITAGNLDVELYYQVEGQEDWTKVTETTNVFKENALWEPGYTEVVKFKVANEGSLALKYQLGVNIVGETGSVNANGENFELSDYIKYGVVNGDQDYTRDQAITAVNETAATLKVPYRTNSILKPGAEQIVTMVVYMPTTVGNEANHAKGAAVPTINLGVNLFATQVADESDSFDNQYDIEAAVFSVADANALMAAGKDATLVGCIDPNGILEAPAGYTGTLTLVDSTVKSVQAAGDMNLVVLGDVVVNAKGSDVATFAATAFDGSAITANGKLTVSGNGNLTAVAADVKGAFGIGGMNTTSITLKDVTVDYVSGGYAYGVGSDTEYYKDAPEGGAAIGSSYNGAEIVLENVTVTKAIGGSKAAAIGARYHVGVTVTIKDSAILYAEGGVSAAGIGGSRVSGGATENGTTINIKNSTVIAKGGAYGAGIGSGYDTHCLSKQPLCTINITDSTINAIGGQYAAGVGTGYHHAALAGEIVNSGVTAVSGEKIYKASYTAAMDVGFGVTDPAREGQQTDSKLIYNGVEITLDSAPAIATSNDELSAKLQAGETTFVLGEGTYVLPNAAQGKTLTIIGSGKTTIATNTSGSYEGCNYALDGSTVVFENITITTDGATYTGYARCNATYNNCVINNTYTLYGDSTFNNCTFNVSGDKYNVWTWGAPTATFNNCTINSDGKALLLYGQANTKLTLNGCTFNDNGGLSDKKAAVEIGNDYNKSYTLTANNTVVNGYEINDKGIFTGSTLWGNKNSMGTDKLTVTINGTQVYGPANTNTLYIDSAAGLFAFAEQVNEKGNTYAGKTVVLVADIDLKNQLWTPIGQTSATQFQGTFDGHGYTIKNLNVNASKQTGANYSSGLFGWLNNATVKNLTIENATVTGNHNVGVIAGYMETSGCTISNCHVVNATVVGKHANGDACGDKVGVIVGHAGNAGVKVENCSATNCSVTAGRDAGQITGAALTANVTGCTAENVTVVAGSDCTGANVREELIGRVLG